MNVTNASTNPVYVPSPPVLKAAEEEGKGMGEMNRAIAEPIRLLEQERLANLADGSKNQLNDLSKEGFVGAEGMGAFSKMVDAIDELLSLLMEMFKGDDSKKADKQNAGSNTDTTASDVTTASPTASDVSSASPAAASGATAASSTFNMTVDDAEGTLFTVPGADGKEIVVATDSENNLVIDGKTYAEVDDDKLTFSTDNGELTVLRDGKPLDGYEPVKLEDGAKATYKLDDINQSSQSGSVKLNDEAIKPSAFFDTATPRANDGGFGSTEIVADVKAVDGANGLAFKEGTMAFSSFLSGSLEEGINGVEKQKFQYGGYDKSTVTTLNTWEDVLATGAVKENEDGSVTLTSSGDVPRVQFYPDDDVDGGRQATPISELRDVKFDMEIDGYEQGDAAWIYELHEVGDGQSMAIGFNEEGKMMLGNGNTQETDISLVDAGGVEINYEGSTANITVLNKDGSFRDEASVEISGSEVHVKGIELYNRRQAADTNVSATFNNIQFGDLNDKAA